MVLVSHETSLQKVLDKKSWNKTVSESVIQAVLIMSTTHMRSTLGNFIKHCLLTHTKYHYKCNNFQAALIANV